MTLVEQTIDERSASLRYAVIFNGSKGCEEIINKWFLIKNILKIQNTFPIHYGPGNFANQSGL